MTFVVTWLTVPSCLMTRASTMIVAYDSFSLTRGSRSGSISSRAHASRITPARCSVPSSSTYPLGSVNGNSVCRLMPEPRSCGHSARSCPDQALVGDGDLFRGDVVGAAVELRTGPLRRPAGGEVPARDLLELRVLRHDRTVAPGGVDVALDDLLAPLPQRARAVDAPLQRDVGPLHGARHLADDHSAFLGGLLVLDGLRLGLDPGTLAEAAHLHTVDLENEDEARGQIWHVLLSPFTRRCSRRPATG